MIEDPFEGPFEGEDFLVDDYGYVHVTNNDQKLAGMIARKVNLSNKFDMKMVRLGTSGDTIVLGFDPLTDVTPVHTDRIGFKKDVLVDVRQSSSTEFYIYVGKRRKNKVYSTLNRAKAAIKLLDKSLQKMAEEPSYDED